MTDTKGNKNRLIPLYQTVVSFLKDLSHSSEYVVSYKRKKLGDFRKGINSAEKLVISPSMKQGTLSLQNFLSMEAI